MGGLFRSVLRGLDLAEQLDRVAADALGGDLDELDDAVGVHEERAAVGQALALAEHVEVGGDRGRRVAEHEVLDLADRVGGLVPRLVRSEEHTSELQSLMRISYAVFCLKKKNQTRTYYEHHRRN